MTTTKFTHLIEKSKDGKVHAIFEDGTTDNFDTIEEVAQAVDNYYYRCYDNMGYTTTYTCKEYKKERNGIVGTVTVKLMEL